MIIDTNTSCLGKTQLLKKKNIDTVGRYYRVATHPEFAITKAEALELSNAGIKIFTVFEEHGKKADLPLTKAQGRSDGSKALNQATNIGQPEGSAIYFAVEGLPSGYTSADLPGIRDYFSGVKEAIGGKYVLGVYGDGIVCKTMLNENFCRFTWLAAASTSFEGTKEFMRSWKWTLAQLGPLDIDTDGLSVDIDAANGEFGAFSVPLVA
jgi:Rv2525c-like, glycoside hydrolase-like domain